MALSAVITPMTENTPIVTPSIVRADLSLLVFSAPSAMRMISVKCIVGDSRFEIRPRRPTNLESRVSNL
jgi:hypothetical protein